MLPEFKMVPVEGLPSGTMILMAKVGMDVQWDERRKCFMLYVEPPDASKIVVVKNIGEVE